MITLDRIRLNNYLIKNIAAWERLPPRPARYGAWLIEQFFQPGNREDWNAHIARATGEPLNPKYFVEALG